MRIRRNEQKLVGRFGGRFWGPFWGALPRQIEEPGLTWEREAVFFFLSLCTETTKKESEKERVREKQQSER